MRMPAWADDHQTRADLESYSLGKLAPSPTPGFERHLLICPRCRTKLSAIEAYNFVHYTMDGPFYSRITRLRTGMFVARHWGRSLEGGKEFRTREGGEAYLVRSFFLLFPEHACTARCGESSGVSEPNNCYSA
jgi:hypothetical protein